MMKAHLSYGRKSPNDQQTYQASVEVEISDTMGGMKQAIATVWNELRKSVDDEMGAVLQSTPIRKIQANADTEASPSRADATPHVAAANDALATQNQINFLLVCSRRGMGYNDQATKEWAIREYGVGLNGLTKRQAGALIDQLQAKAG